MQTGQDSVCDQRDRKVSPPSRARAVTHQSAPRTTPQRIPQTDLRLVSSTGSLVGATPAVDHHKSAKLYQFATALGLIGGAPSRNTILQFSAANWVLRELASEGGNLTRAIGVIQDTIAQGSLHISTTDDELIIWSRSEAHTATRTLSVPLDFIAFSPAGVQLRDLIAIGAWREVLRSLAHNTKFPRCRRPVMWMRDAMRSITEEAIKQTIQAVELTLEYVALRNPSVRRDMARWMRAGRWRKEENGGRAGVGRVGWEEEQKIMEIAA